MLLFGCTNGSTKTQNTNPKNPNDAMQDNGIVNDNGNMKVDNKMNNDKMMNESMQENGSIMYDNMKMPPNYIPFDKSAYDQARASGKVIYLEFYANWCPDCKAQAPILNEAFSEIKNPKVIGFRVNYKDSDTDSNEIDMARQFGITYQHTHVILDKNGNVAKKATGSWDKDTIESEIAKVAN